MHEYPRPHLRQDGGVMRFILLDRIDELQPGARAAGIKCVTLADPVFVDHFADHPVYPGSLLIESMAQLGGCLAEASYHHEHSSETRRALLIQVDRAKFHQPCAPGDQLQIVCELVSMLGFAAQVSAQVRKGRDDVAAAVLNFRLVEVASAALHAQRRALYRQWTSHWPQPPELR